MRLLLDESLPRALKQLLSAHEVATVPEYFNGVRLDLFIDAGGNRPTVDLRGGEQ